MKKFQRRYITYIDNTGCNKVWILYCYSHLKSAQFFYGNSVTKPSIHKEKHILKPQSCR